MRSLSAYYPITVITLGPPSKPKGPIRFEIKADSVIMSWDVPDDGGGEITCYSIEKREASQTNWKMVCSDCQDKRSKFLI